MEVTGGEPLIQAETPSLIARLLDEGYTVLLETNGSIDKGGVDPRCVRIMDIKCPSSGMAGQNDLRNLEKLGIQDELKFVIANREDYEFAKDILSTPPAIRCKINFSPVFGALAPGLSPNGFSRPPCRSAEPPASQDHLGTRSQRGVKNQSLNSSEYIPAQILILYDFTSGHCARNRGLCGRFVLEVRGVEEETSKSSFSMTVCSLLGEDVLGSEFT